jgi:hypothetical protein
MSFRPQNRPFLEDTRQQQHVYDKFYDSHRPSDIESVNSINETPPARLPERSSSGKLFMLFMCFSCCMCVFTILGALVLLPTDRLRDSTAPTVPQMSALLLRIIQLKTRDDDENHLEQSTMQALFPEWRSVQGDLKTNFNSDRVLSDLILAVRELARRRY